MTDSKELLGKLRLGTVALARRATIVAHEIDCGNERPDLEYLREALIGMLGLVTAAESMREFNLKHEQKETGWHPTNSFAGK